MKQSENDKDPETIAEKIRFKSILAGIAEVYRPGFEFSKASLRGWYEILIPYDLDDIDNAFILAAREPGRKWLPSPGEIIMLIQSIKKEQRRISEAKQNKSRWIEYTETKPIGQQIKTAKNYYNNLSADKKEALRKSFLEKETSSFNRKRAAKQDLNRLSDNIVFQLFLKQKGC